VNVGDLDAIALAERVLSILEEGGFSATYKFALFTAILDLCIEKSTDHGTLPETLTTRQLALKVVDLYWNHATPYGSIGTLRQGGGRGEQATILWHIEEARARWVDLETTSTYRASRAHPLEFRDLVDFVEWKLIEMPIPRLQVLGRQQDQFLYEYNWPQDVRRSAVTRYQRGNESAFDNRLLLRPGVAEQLVRLNGMLRPLFHREWAAMVARMNKLPEAQLERFLFGSERTSLDAVRSPLRHLQDNRCFYCESTIVGPADVDHFIPWSRYPDDGLDNLVAAHPKCNNSKRDFLAAADHVERWAERSRSRSAELADLARAAGWPHEPTRSRSVTAAIYLRLPATARLWRRPNEFALMDHGRIARALTGSPRPFSPRS
jgi:hypothetical protein